MSFIYDFLNYSDKINLTVFIQVEIINANLRIVEIVGLDKQADGGTHVRNLKEVGQIELIGTKNKGKHNRRVYFKLV